ncbi:MAG: 23S rRNA (uracil(1939)-C(5))-methyltransferase RlmD [Candidatus Zixiibacteriota bacterium]
MNEKLRKFDTIELEIEDLALTGKSIGHHNGMVIMADQGLPGERISCQVTMLKRRYGFARFKELLRSSPRRIEPRCSNFKQCGGCTWQNLEYADQVGYKAGFIREALARIGKLSSIPIDPPVVSAETFYYRNKMEYSFGHNDDVPAVGMHVRGRFDKVFDLKECFLQSELSVLALDIVRQSAIELNIPFMNERSGVGELRFLVVREGKLTGDLMLNLVTFNREFSGRDELFDRIIKGVPGVTSLFHTVNGKKANVAIGDELILIHGEPHLTEMIGDLKFQITPFSFFQTNSRQTKALYDVIKEHAAPASDQEILDLFCGCGTISLYLARYVKNVLGIELNAEAIEMAKLNAELNHIDNVEFLAGDARKMLVELAHSGRHFDTIITDPPRAGMETKAIQRIVRLRADKIVAVSCNPATLARDLELFAEAGYATQRVTPVDMFPQTAHIEAVATLLRDPEFNPPLPPE